MATTKKFLDLTGLGTLWTKIKAYITSALSNKLDKTGNAYRASSIPMGTVDSTSTATAFTATVDGITELRNGVCVWLTNGVVTSGAGFTIDINSLGAKPVYGSLDAATAATTIFNKNYTMLFVYNSTRAAGGCWDIVCGYDSNTTYTPVKLGFGYATCSTAAATAAKTASLSSYTLNTGGIVVVKFTNAVPANATLNINSKGAKAIYYKGAAITNGVIKAGDTATFIYSTNYHLIAIDRQVEFDSAPTQNSENAVTSGALYSALSEKIGKEDAAVYVHMTSNGLTDGATVSIAEGVTSIFAKLSTQQTVYFILNGAIAFYLDYFNTSNGAIKLHAAYDMTSPKKWLYISLAPATSTTMSGTLSVIPAEYTDGDEVGY